ncbi:MAG: peptidase E [Candidatus Pacebacteria bacterium CG10_big_fil_rev_8_21_14_0_10_42_12]|nr:MAG: peptidase E [Candidatus Pacebacteria bacterium CG10_big_fil_rev_8_21_14_0_10_42_12]
MNKYIVAIGGGEIDQLETLKIDRKIVSLSEKKHPKLLFIPTASEDDAGYVRTIENIYGKKLGCAVDSLLLLRGKPSKKEIETRIHSADIVYVGGGNALKMMKVWRRLGVDQELKTSYEDGTVMSGISAGAICWFDYGHSDSMSFYQPGNWKYIRVRGTKILKGICCPHFNGETLGAKRKKRFVEMISRRGGTGIAIDDQAAIISCNNTYEVISAKKNAGAYRVFKKNGEIVVESIEEREKLTLI